MNLIESLQHKLNTLNIQQSFFDTYTRAQKFAVKLTLPFVAAPAITYFLYSYLHINTQVTNASHIGGLFLFGLILPICLIPLLFSFLFPLNGALFKTVSHFIPSNKFLSSYIHTLDYQDKIIHSLFDNKDFVHSILNFYELINNISFSHINNSHSRYYNEFITENYKTLQYIITTNDNDAFVTFFKSKFIHDWTKYSQHDKVTAILNITHPYSDNHDSNKTIINEHFIQNNITEVIIEEPQKTIKEQLKEKFKKIL